MTANGEGRGARTVRALTLLVTNVTKLAGVYIALANAGGAHDALTYGVAAFMMAGAQVSEELLLGAVSRFFGVTPTVSEPKRKGGRRS